jgi:hypothetical protein
MSLCVPASVEHLSVNCFSGLPQLSSLTFASGSLLKLIEGLAFSHCPALKSICLPALLFSLSGYAFVGSSIEHIFVDAASPYFFASGPFLLDFKRITVIRYFGRAENLTVPRAIEVLGSSAFTDIMGLLTVDFEEGSRLTRIEHGAFSDCSGLKSIWIPASVEILVDHCFGNCFSLSQLTFGSGSRLTRIDSQAFLGCKALPSICVPSQVECIPSQCFYRCCSLVELLFEPNSQLTRIEPRAFKGCDSLRSITIPPQVETIEPDTLDCCESLCQFTFEVPSRLKEINLPPSNFGVLKIPDSVEVLTAAVPGLGGERRVLAFGRESHLVEIHLIRYLPSWDSRNGWDRTCCVFICLGEETLRRFRCRFED